MLGMSNPIQFALKQFAFYAIMYAMVLQPMAESFQLLNNPSYEFVGFDLEDDTEENEDVKEDSKPKKVQQKSGFASYTSGANINSVFNIDTQNLFSNYCLEILIPPPEQI